MPRKVMSDSEKVTAVLADCAEYPASAAVGLRAVLAKGLPEVVDVLRNATTLAEREVPRELLQMITKILRNASECCLELLKDDQVAVEEASALCDAGDASHDSSSATLEEARARVEQLNSEVNAARETAATEQSNHADVEAATKHILESQATLEKEVALSRQIAVLVQDLEAGVPATALASMVDVVLGYLADKGAEQALQVAAHSALQRLPAERQAFDVATLEAMKAVLAEWQAHLDEKLAMSAAAVEGAKAERVGAWAILTLARERLADLEEASTQAEQALEVAALATREAESERKSLRKALSERLVQQTLTEVKASEINEALAALGRLSDPTPLPAPAHDTVQDVAMTQDVEDVEDVMMTKEVEDVTVTKEVTMTKDIETFPALVGGRRVATAGAGFA
eukprot:CAMPEP_0170612762 /NCGR_PEP_ID=MMETSP0224-20130122/23899_1 /TAXON_ID=285029 /ORGANISM="Togula jolla, Strain CCCM 725" /LENGTH=399 /DNA_ID=CAMNT_0010938293 /DNA_START=57 /DNA_END=1256 /DNA_ORIENTATION=+